MIVDERTLIYSISSTIHKGYRRQSRSGSCSALARRTLARSTPHLRRVGGVVVFFVACDGSSRVIPKCQFCVLECPFVFTTRSLYPPGRMLMTLTRTQGQPWGRVPGGGSFVLKGNFLLITDITYNVTTSILPCVPAVRQWPVTTVGLRD